MYRSVRNRHRERCLACGHPPRPHPDDGRSDNARQLWNILASHDGVIATHVLSPDPDLSTPLPGEDPASLVFDPILLIEGTSESVVFNAARVASEQADATDGDLGIMRMMWRLHAREIPSHRHEKG
jgi:hypothetical protein